MNIRDKHIKELLELGGLEIPEVTPEIRFIFSHVSRKNFLTPLVLKAKSEGLEQGKIAIRYGLSIDQVKYIFRDKRKSVKRTPSNSLTNS